MHTFIRTSGLILFILILTVDLQGGNPWELRRDRSGIQVYTRKFDAADSKLKDSKVVMRLPVKAADVVEALEEVSKYTSWVPKCKQAYVVKREGRKIIYYTEYKAPMVSNRELIASLECNLKADGNGKCIIRQVRMPNVGEKGNVKIPRFYGEWNFQRKGGELEITNWYSMDPGGSVPEWLVNTSAVDSPYDTFKSLREYLGF